MNTSITGLGVSSPRELLATKESIELLKNI